MAASVAARARHMLGPDAEHELSPEQAMAWEGMLELSRRLRRRAEEVLAAEDDLSVSMLGVTGRLARADRRTLRQNELADAMGLSVSRTSRVVDLLERRGFVRREPCPSDARVTNVVLTRTGAARTARAQQRLYGLVRAAFFDQLRPDEVATFAAVFTRLLG
jgi:DNA-binding MarR family transcriptional regulator